MTLNFWKLDLFCIAMILIEFSWSWIDFDDLDLNVSQEPFKSNIGQANSSMRIAYHTCINPRLNQTNNSNFGFRKWMGFFNVRFNRALPCQLECYHSDPAQIECSMVSVVAYNEMVMMFWYVEFIKKKKTDTGTTETENPFNVFSL